jgi:DNA-binding MarR family transcriptional regulator
MKIEQVIQQQKPFRNASQKAIINLIYTTNWVTDRIKSILKPYGITMQQYNVLRILRGAGEPISTSVIRERMLDKMSDTSRMVDRLHQKGLVMRTPCPDDKRLVDVRLSVRGRQLIDELDRLDRQIDQVLDGLSEEEARQLSRLLDKIRD